MKRIVFLLVMTLVAAAVIPTAERAAATPVGYDLTCATFASPKPSPQPNGVLSIPFYPVPGAGGPDRTDASGLKPQYRGTSSCGWISRAFRSGEPTNLCFEKAGVGGDEGRFTTYNVYSDGRSCMVVNSQTDASAPSYPDVPVVCHGPLRAGSAPAASFYSEVEGTLKGQGFLVGGGAVGNPTLAGGLSALPAGACAAATSAGSNQLRNAAFCVANDQDQAYKNQLQDLLNPRFYQMTVHADPGCNIYEKGTLADWQPLPQLPHVPLPR